METRNVLFLHGFASSGGSTKAQYLRRRFEAWPQVAFFSVDFAPTPTDFRYATTTGLINRLRQYVLDRNLDRAHIIGSSYGGLIALHYAHRFGGVERMLLLAPGLRWLSGGLSEEELLHWEGAGEVSVYHPAFEEELPVRYDLHLDGLRYLEFIPPPAPLFIIHGDRDLTVPTDHSRAYAADYPNRVQLVEVDADHDLNGHLDLIWQYVESFLLSGQT